MIARLWKMAGNLFLRQKLQSESADAAGADDRTMTMAAAAAAADLLGSNSVITYWRRHSNSYGIV
jgi:hypothetical protein